MSKNEVLPILYRPCTFFDTTGGIYQVYGIYSAGTMHKVMYKVLKKFFPDGDQRRWVLMDIAIFLARGRGQVYARDLCVLEMAAAAQEGADVGE